MNTTFRNILLGVSAVLMFALTGCGGGYDCSSTACPKDDKPTQAAIDACEKAKDAACGSQLEDYGSCLQDNIKCVDDKTDPASGIDALSKCASEIAAATKCCSENPTVAGCTGSGG